MANNLTTSKNPAFSTRVAKSSDAAAIFRMMETAKKRHVHVDWHLPREWLGFPSFIVASPQENKSSGRSIPKFLGKRERFAACLVPAAEPKPVAWMRLALVAEDGNELSLFQEMLAQAESALRADEVEEIAWLAITKDFDDWLPPCGFEIINYIETYTKVDNALPELPPLDDVHIRTAVSEDYARLTEIEKAAFAPLWRYSEKTFIAAQSQALSFDVLELSGEIVGFQLSSHTHTGAHLVRITIHPDYQQHGVGSHLMAHAIRGYHRHGLRQITLNTQVDNVHSPKLYRKFGFESEGYRLPIWHKHL